MASQISDQDEIIAGINITPLVDIILVVLIIFIVTASFVLRSKIPVDLPAAQSAESSAGGLLNLAITREGVLYINGQPSTLDGLPAAVAEARARQGERPVSAFISADVQAQYGAFAAAVDRLRVEGVLDIALDTRPPDQAAAASPPGEAGDRAGSSP
ncbi:MAG: biopolymer transporter ExbD [Myxococcota bacterium]|jgi:biopolymer transport protein ExbD|nr:biopolymer transporter ExbD [Myxococcota bacterium]